MFKELITRGFAGIGVIAAALSLTLCINVLPAHAVVVDTDRPRIPGTPLDFGTNWGVGGPLNGGYLTWDVAGGLTTPHLTGNLYINNAAGTCGRMRIESYDINFLYLNSVNGGTVCAPDNSRHTWSVNLFAPGDPDTTHVHVVIEVQNASGAYSTAGIAEENLA